MRSKSHCYAERLTTAKINRHQVLVCTFRHTQLLGKKASTTEISELKIEGKLENSKVSFPQSWHFIPFLTHEKSEMASAEDSLLLNPHNRYTDRNTGSLYQNLLCCCSQGLLWAPIQLSCLCNSCPSARAFTSSPQALLVLNWSVTCVWEHSALKLTQDNKRITPLFWWSGTWILWLKHVLLFHAS